MQMMTNTIDHYVGAQLRSMRKIQGLSQGELAQNVGITFQNIREYEHGKKRIPATVLWKFCHVLNANPIDFFDGVEDEIMSDEENILSKIAEASLHLDRLQDPELKRSILELIHICKNHNN